MNKIKTITKDRKESPDLCRTEKKETSKAEEEANTACSENKDTEQMRIKKRKEEQNFTTAILQKRGKKKKSR